MAKKNKSASNNSQSNSKAQKDRSRNTAILIAAILFFLLGLWMLARASGWEMFNPQGMGSGDATGRGFFIIRTTQPTGGVGGPGSPGGPGNPGGPGGPGNNGGNGGPGGANLLEDLDVNVQTQNGVQLDAGINDGQLYVDPQINPNPQGGVGAEVNINDQNVIDTGNLLGR